MTDLATAMGDATVALNNATLAFNNYNGQIAANLAATTASTTTIVNNFINRPALLSVYCDPLNGNDANDGSTPDLAKKSIDNIIDNMGSNATEIRLLNDATFQVRHNIYAPLQITGVQKSANAAGFDFATHTISFLGTATNSPSPIIGTFCAGFQLSNPSVRLDHININIPDVPSALNTRSIFTNLGSTSITFTGNPTISVQSAQAGSLIGSGGHAIVTMSPVLGSGTAGHLFDGIAAGANPNNSWGYSTNVTSA